MFPSCVASQPGGVLIRRGGKDLIWRRGVVVLIWMAWLLGAVRLLAYPVVTNVAQLVTCPVNPAATNSGFQIQLTGAVWWVDPSANELVLHDASGTERLELDLSGQSVQAGQTVSVEGYATVTRAHNGFRLGVIGPVVDNDGFHSLVEKSGTVYLAAGRQPFRLEWFNGISQYGLAVEYQGPDVRRQSIPSTALFRARQSSVADATGASERGVNYSVYEVPGEVLPDFNQLTAIRSGMASNFDLDMLPHPEHVGVVFRGALAVPRTGFYTFFVKSDDGSQWYIGEPSVHIRVLGAADFPRPRPMALGQALVPISDVATDYEWVEVEGVVTFACEVRGGWQVDLSSDTGHIRVQVADPADGRAVPPVGQRLRATGICAGARTTDGQRVADTLLVPGSGAWIQTVSSALPTALADETNANPSGLPVLTSAGAVHRLKREDAQRGYPVKMAGVVTCVLPEHQAFTLQDSTRGLYFEDFSASRAFLPQIGEALEVAGTTDSRFFAPVVNVQHLESLGAGHLPDPVRPTWDQLLNGSLDAQYVELQGIITAVTGTNVTMLTRDGRIHLELRLAGPDPARLTRYEDALVRVRGTFFANWDYLTHEVKVGEIRIYGASISVDREVPQDLFALPAKSVADLLRFDPQASVFQRVKVSGQIVHGRDTEFYLTDGRNALRFNTREPVAWQAGDLVDVTGFPDLSGASPRLREAVARKTGRAPLPPAQALSADNLARAEVDATRVRVRGVLVSVRQTHAETILEIQSGVRTFAARWNAALAPAEPPPAGSLLELTGVCASLGANRAGGQGIAGFELLLNSADDLRVLARPPWWTLERLLIMVGALVCGLAVTGLWITQLHRQVEQRTAELATQIQQRQRVEQQHAMEQERARVAQDLHDELGSSLTEITMLGARARSAAANEAKRTLYLDQLSAKAREIVTALDEIVWAMNPRHDSLASLVSYFCLYADRFLGLANIAWRLEGAAVPEEVVVDSRHRHQLFLAFKEGLTNVVRHSGAQEVRLAIALDGGQVRLTLTDNGRGLQASLPTEEMDGLANMRARLEKLGGRFEISSEPGRGTTLRFFLPAR